MLRRGLVCAALLVAALLSTTASAQSDDDLERARTLFAEGVDATHEERWDDAIDRFRQVLAVRATPQVKYNLGIALERAGHLVEARALLTEVVDHRELDRRARREVREVLRSIEPRIGQLTVRVESDDPSGARVTLDGAELPAERWGQATPVDPGEHALALIRGERALVERTITVPEGGSEEIAIEDPGEPDLTPELEPEPAPVIPDPAPARSVLEEWWFWTAIAAVVVLIGGVSVGLALGGSGPQPVQGNLTPGILEVTLP